MGSNQPVSHTTKHLLNAGHGKVPKTYGELECGSVISNGEDKQQVTKVQAEGKFFLTRHRVFLKSHNVKLQNHSQIKQTQQKDLIFSKE